MNDYRVSGGSVHLFIGGTRRRGLAALFFLAAGLLAFCTCARAETPVAGTIGSDTTWSAGNSPYHVTGNILVSSGVTLTIQTGVTVRVDPGYSLRIDGTLVARGTSAAPILFTMAQSTEWAYMLFSDSSIDATYDSNGNYVSGCILEYCTVEYAGSGNNSALKIDNASPLLNACIIRNNKANAIYVFYSSGSWNAGAVKITGCDVSQNTGSGVYVSAYGGRLQASNNRFTQNGGHGLYLSVGNAIASGASITKNLVRGNKDAGVYIIDSSYYATLADNLIIENNPVNYAYAGGVVISGGSSNRVIRNIIADNNNTVSGSSPGGLQASGDVQITNNAILRNTALSTAGVYFSSASGFTYNTLWANTATGSTNTRTMYLAGNNVDITYNNILDFGRL